MPSALAFINPVKNAPIDICLSEGSSAGQCALIVGTVIVVIFALPRFSVEGVVYLYFYVVAWEIFLSSFWIIFGY